MDKGAAEHIGGLYHVALIGFHHKKGCVVEYAYPPLADPGESGEIAASFLPEEWKFLPSLAMPDGAHNFTEDVVYFHLPPRAKTDREAPSETVYCVSYCRQVDANLLSQKDEHVTRGTVQKSVVILSKIPAFGLIHAKLQLPLITDAFLENFYKKDILKELYNQINATLNISDESHLFFGLSARKLLKNFKHKLVVLFKLILLEKRVVFYTSPASVLVDTLLSLLSLFPRMIEIGLSKCTSEQRAAQSEIISDSKLIVVSSETSTQEEPTSETPPNKEATSEDPTTVTEDNGSSIDSPFEVVQNTVQNTDCEPNINDSSNEQESKPISDEFEHPPPGGQRISRAGNMMSRVAGKFNFLNSSPVRSSLAPPTQNTNISFDNLDPENDDDDSYMLKLGNARLEMNVGSPEKSVVKGSDEPERSTENDQDVIFPSPFQVDENGFPLSIFTDGNLCLPYISLQHHDLIQNHSMGGFVVGATNILFQTRRELSDVVVDIESGEIIFHDPNLQKQLALSAADLRMAEHIVSNILEYEVEDFFNAATEWRGGDEWLRSLFAEYLHRMLCVVSKESIDERKVNDFNESFVEAWKRTKNFRIWRKGQHKTVDDSELQHPFHGQYSINDVRLRLHHRLQNSEQGRKLEGAISNANDTIVNTGRYIGNALGSAKTSLSSWLSNKLQNSKN